MNILYAVNSGAPGGVEQHVLELTKGMIAGGHKVFIWCLDGPIVEWYTSVGAKVTTRKILFEIDPLYIFSLVKFIKSNSIGVVHGHELKAGVNAIIAANMAGVKTKITHVHTPISEWQIKNPVKKVLVNIEAAFYAMFVNMFSDAEIALTASRKKTKIGEGMLTNRLVVIPNGIDTRKFLFDEESRNQILTKYNIPADSLVIGNVGRMTTEKGHSILVEAFSKVSSEKPLILLLAGGGALEESLRQKCKDLGIDSKVRITGIFENADLHKYYSAIDLFVFSSLAEGFGIVLIEAMSSALPVISSDLDVLKEVGGKDVIYFKTGDPEDLKNKILQALKLSEVQRKEIGVKLQERVSHNFSMKNFIENYIKLYS